MGFLPKKPILKLTTEATSISFNYFLPLTIKSQSYFMSRIPNIISFYKDCYLFDFKASTSFNFFGKSVEHQYFTRSFEPFNKRLEKFPVNSEWGASIDEDLLLNSKEKGLYAAAFFIKGSMPILSRQQKVFAPLYLFEATLHVDDGIYSVSVNIDDPILNPAFFDYLKYADPNLDLTYANFADSLPKGPLNFDNLHILHKKLQDFVPTLGIESINELLESNTLEDPFTIYQKKASKKDFRLIASALFGLLQKPKGSRGIINELTTLSTEKTSQSVLSTLFGQNKTKIEKRTFATTINVPVSLSEHQKKVFTAHDTNPITLVIGPPGTGKSFTIASLTANLISKGKSVLIASKNNQAGNVIANKIDKDLGLKGLVIKTANASYRTHLRTRIWNILNGISLKSVTQVQLQVLEREISDLNIKIEHGIKQLKKREEEEIKWGRFLYNKKIIFFGRIQQKWIEHLHGTRTEIWKIKKEIDQLEVKRIKQTKHYIKEHYNFHLYNNLHKRRTQLLHLANALTETKGNLIHQEFNKIDFDVLLKALPAWICNTSNIHNTLPLSEGLFDVAIIDEATQCDIASSIPIFYRAKKIIIVGDPKQLKHISFLSKFQEEKLKEKHAVPNAMSYRSNSVLDLVNKHIQKQEQVIFLNEHYRSSPDIIDFSNKQFYAKALDIMTTSPINNKKKSLFLETINGKRTDKGVNAEEAKFIVESIKKQIEDESNLSPRMCKSIGIISPFRAQVNYLKTLARKEIGLYGLKRHHILIGTPFHFQGEERDSIFISFVLDDESHPGSFQYLNRKDVFNVTITRARSLQIICTSLSFKTLDRKYLLSQYLNSIHPIQVQQKNTESEQDIFAKEVINFIKQKLDKVEILEAYRVAGVTIDIVVIKNDKTYCIDLVGCPGVYEKQFTYAKIKMLDRMNHPVHFITYTDWHLTKLSCQTTINAFLNNGL